jgi:hypothetical protein
LPPRGTAWRAVADVAEPAATDEDDDPTISGVVGAERTLVAVGDRLYRATRGRLHPLAMRLPDDATLVGVDAAGRAYAIRGGALIRSSRRHGWRRLLGRG